jgi:hypothetical protein
VVEPAIAVALHASETYLPSLRQGKYGGGGQEYQSWIGIDLETCAEKVVRLFRL